MSMKIVLVAAAGVLAVSPALAMSKNQIVHHTGGPIPYSQLASMDKSGYNARSHKKAGRTTSGADTSVAANTTTGAAPGATPSPDQTTSGAVNAPAPAAPSAAAGPDALGPTTQPNAAPTPSALPPATTPQASTPAAPTNPAASPNSAAPSSPAATAPPQ
jgi:hypothetical protein